MEGFFQLEAMRMMTINLYDDDDDDDYDDEPEDIPSTEVVDDFHERLLPIRGDVVQRLAAFVEVLHLMMTTISLLNMMMIMMVTTMMMIMMVTMMMGVTFHSMELY